MYTFGVNKVQRYRRVHPKIKMTDSNVVNNINFLSQTNRFAS